jgi:hypothetical protein
MASSFDDFSGGFDDDSRFPPESSPSDEFFGSMAEDQPRFGIVAADPYRFLYVGLGFYEKMANLRK